MSSGLLRRLPSGDVGTGYDEFLIPERGEVSVPSHVWEGLAEDADLWTLVCQKVLSVSGARDGMVLKAGPFVGRARLGAIDLVVVPKIRGALEALISYASKGAFRVERVAAPETEPGDLTSLLIAEFLDAVERYLAEGRDFAYQSRQDAGPFVRGAVDIPRTMQLWATGRNFEAAYRASYLTHGTPLNRLVAFALQSVDRLVTAVTFNDDLIVRARSHAMLFGAPRTPARDPQLTAEPPRSFSPARRDLWRLAQAIAAASGFEPQGRLTGGEVPRSWFLNLENLFETAVRTSLTDLEGVVWVRNGAVNSLPVFSRGEEGELAASPDLVGETTAGTFVGDVKYKGWSGSALPGDLYQLLVHAAAYNSTRAFLVYPGDDFAVRWLGTSVTGCDVWIFRVAITSLPGSLADVVAEIDRAFT